MTVFQSLSFDLEVVDILQYPWVIIRMTLIIIDERTGHVSYW